MQISMKIALCVFLAICTGIIQVNSCRISQWAAAGIVGKNISVICNPDSGDAVNAWKKGDDSQSAPRVFTSAVYDSTGHLLIPAYIAPGYNVSSDGRVLTMNNVTVAYVGYYYCACQLSTNSTFTYVSVIDAEPQFVASDSLKMEDPVTLTCSLSVTGITNSSIEIIDLSGDVLRNSSKNISSSISEQHSLNYTVPRFTETTFFCNISLTNDKNESAIITTFTSQLNVALHLMVRNVSISTENSQVCQKDDFCKRNIKLLCQLEGMSASSYQWTIYVNGTVSSLNNKGDSYITQYIGLQVIQCTASKRTDNTFYYGSTNFTTNVTTDVYVPPPTSDPENASLAIGLGVGLGGGVILLIIIFVIVLCLCKRKKRKQQKEGKEEVQIEANTYEGLKGKDKATKGSAYEGTIKKKQKEKPKGPPATKTNGKTKGTKKVDETTLVDNNLYSKTENDENNVDSVYNTSIHGEDNPVMSVYNTSIHGVDPSDGGYADLDEFGAKGKF